MQINSQDSRTLKVDGNLLVSLIYNQAGSVGKAILEAVMNSIDAQATEVRVYLNCDGIHYEVHDDGIGFRSTEEIQKYFEVFGFDHSADTNRKRVYGQFGMGRAQLWAFSRTLFLSNGHTMDVDIKTRGLTYIPGVLEKPIKGTKIYGEFYEKKTPLDLDSCKRELKEMVAFTPVPVYLNDELISTDPKTKNWSVETDDAYIEIAEINELKIYNQGVYVRAYNAWQFGVGGIVVSKERLELNMARNDVVVAKCEVWKRISKEMRKKGVEKTVRKKSLNDDDRFSLIRNLISGEIDTKLDNKRIIKDIRNRAYTIEGMLKFPAVTLCDSTPATLVAEKIQMSKIAFIVHPQVLHWFNVNCVAALMEKLIEIMEKKASYCWTVEKLRAMPIAQYKDVAASFSEDHEILPKKELKPRQLVQLRAIQQFNASFVRLANRVEPQVKNREIKLARSDSALAFTDGVTFIAIDVRHVKALDRGIDGVLQVIHSMVHEYLHNEPSIDQHSHDLAFYENFHDCLSAARIGSLAFKILQYYWKRLEAGNLAVNKPVLQDLSQDIGVFFEDKPIKSNEVNESCAPAKNSKPSANRARPNQLPIFGEITAAA